MDLIKSGKLIKKLRLSQNMTQKQVADILGGRGKNRLFDINYRLMLTKFKAAEFALCRCV